MSPLQFVLLIALIGGGFAALYLSIKKANSAQTSNQQLEDLTHKIFGLTSQHIAEQSRSILQAEKETIQVDLANKQHAIEQLVRNLQTELRERQQELRTTEQLRTQKFAELTTSLDQHRKLAEDLRVSTQQLAGLLSNNQARGEWGERIIEDLLRANGLIEGIHYRKQTKLNDTTLRPDITLLLPDDRTVPVDVKFPYAAMQKLALAESKPAQAEYLKQFASDLKVKIQKVSEYIDPSFHTLDYAILFVPNEMIFSFMNQRFPDLMDEAMAKRVIIVSPFTFLIVARTVVESYRNFMVEEKIGTMLQSIHEFVNEWSKFQDELGKFGRSIESLRSGYETLTHTRTNQLERKIQQISTTEQGQLLTATPSRKKPSRAE